MRIARNTAGSVDYYFGDFLGSARVVTGANGNILDDCDFLPFGEEYCVTQTSGNTYQFTGHERDSETGNDHFPARYYENTLGRWLSPDPANAGADSSNPQSWNAYSYAGDNPTTNLDADGEDYYLLGGEACGDTVQCDKQGYVLDQSGNREVITDQQVLGGDVGVTLGQNGVSAITTDQGTFQAEFFDSHPQTVTVGISDEDRALLIFSWAGRMASNGVKVGAALTAPEWLAAGVATIGLAGGGTTALELQAPEGVTPTEGQVAQASRVLAQDGREAVEKAVRNLERRIAEHETKITSATGYTSSLERELQNFKGLLQAYKQVLGRPR